MRIVDIGAGTGINKALVAAGKTLGEQFPVEVFSFSSEDLDNDERLFRDMLAKAEGSELIILRLHGGVPYFKKFPRLEPMLDTLTCPVFIQSEMPEEMREFRAMFPLPDGEYNLLNMYVQLAGDDNARGLILWALRQNGMDIEVPAPVRPRTEGLYHPGFGKAVSLKDYLATLDPQKPSAGLMFWQGQWLTGDLKAVDALIHALEEQGMNVIPVFVQSSPNTVTGAAGIRRTVERYFTDNGRSRIDVLILNMGFSQLSLSSPGDGLSKAPPFNFFDALDVPVLQATTTYSSRDEWEESIQGIGATELSSNIVWPEYDGQVITVPIASTENKDGHGSREAVPIPGRIEKAASLAQNWAKLRRTPAPERKIAIILHQNPPRNDGVGGAFGLDAPQSVVEMLTRFRERGYHVDHVPGDGNEVVREILAGISNDTEWLSPKEMLTRAAGRVAAEEYRQWLDAVPEKPAGQIRRDWGSPPGELFTADDAIVIPGVINGNIFIGLQPPRGFLEQLETMYHSTDLTIPHNYLAWYRWLKYGFGADAVIHLGTHGTLEWLPGKAVGMSEECFPDIVLDDLPNLYPYIIDNPGEGIQAKRRSWCVILDHMIPAMTRADGYAGLADLDVKLQDFFRASRGGESSKAARLLEDIHRDVIDLHLCRDLGLAEDITPQALKGELERLYDYLCDVRDNLIKDGLHIFGNPPGRERFEEMVYSLTRLRNGSIPSLRESIAAYRGYDLRELQDNPSGSVNGIPYGVLLEEIDSLVRDLIHNMSEAGYAAGPCVELCDTMFPGHNGEPVVVVTHICENIVPGLYGTGEEIENCLRGMDAGYVPPGPSGSPTRGNSHLLPTGKNFYSIDPAIIPTPAAWEVGKKLAEQMVERHINEEGTYPENVGIVVFATDTMKTGGDDIAYILWLLGLRPVWSARGGIISGLEVIPLEELGRPRVDVTLRITGLFRDAFPNLVALIDDGVETIAGLYEDEEKNYLVKHLKRDMIEAVKQGLDGKTARERALIRIFGCPPGTYGVGVGEVIEGSGWDEKKDLADVYVNWGAHAYGRKFRGEKMPELFRQRLGELDVTVKNHNSRELDILDNDDDFMYHGGMIASVKAYGGTDPLAVVGDSSDPERPKTRTVEEEGRFVYRSRVLNPKWLEGLKQHGYRGAQELSALVDYSFGWDATADVLDDWMYSSLADRFLFDRENREWIEENNPYALRQMAGRLLEAYQRGMWDADEETVRKLTDIYMETEDILEGLTE